MKLAVILSLLLSTLAFGAGIDQKFPGSDRVVMGVSSSVDDKEIEFNTGDGASNVKITVTDALGVVINSDDITVGDGTASDKNITFDIGGSNPQIKWDNAAAKLQFSNDGTIYKDIGSGAGGGSGLNVLQDFNADMENNTPSTTPNWTESGGTLAEETANIGNGAKSLAWDASATSQTLDSEAVTIGATSFAELRGNNCTASIYYSWNSGTAGELTLQLVQGASTVLSEVDLVPTSSSVPWARAETPATLCPSSDTIKLRILSSADAAEIILDDAFLGRFELINLSQAELALDATYPATANCLWTRLDTAIGAFGTDADCPAITVNKVTTGITVNTTDDDLPTLVFSNLKPARYVLQVQVPFTVLADTATGRLALRKDTTDVDVRSHRAGISSARTEMVLTHSFDYSGGAIPAFDLACSSDSSACRIELQSNSANIRFVMYRFPLDQQQAVKPDVSGWYVDVNMGGANPSLGVSNVTTYSGITDGSLDLVVNSGSVSALQACATTEESSGLTCSGNESVGISFTIPKAGVYEVCGQFSHSLSIDTDGETVDTTFQWVETPNNAQTISQEGKGRVGNRFQAEVLGTYTNNYPHHLCGLFTFSSIGKKTVRLFYEQQIGGTPVTSDLRMDRNASFGQRDMHISVRPWIGEQPAPLLVNSVVSTYSGVTRTEWVRVTNAGTPTVESQSGDWLGSPALTDNGTGDTTVNFKAGSFSSAPTCIPVSTAVVSHFVALPTTSGVTVRTRDSGFSLIDNNFNLFCIGNK